MVCDLLQTHGCSSPYFKEAFLLVGNWSHWKTQASLSDKLKRSYLTSNESLHIGLHELHWGCANHKKKIQLKPVILPSLQCEQLLKVIVSIKTCVWILIRRMMGQLLSPAQWTFKILQLASCRFLQHGIHCQGNYKANTAALSCAFSTSAKEAQPENVLPARTTHWSYTWVARFSAIRNHNIYNNWQNLYLPGFYN